MGSYLAFWPFGPLFPFILAFWAFISFHFDLLGFHFLSFWPFCPLFPVILAFWACISFHFGLLGLVGLHFLAFWLCGLHFLAFWPFRGQLLGSPPTSCQKWPVCPTSLQWIYQRQDRLHFAVFSLLGLYFLAFWPCRPSFPCILALWAFISLHFGLVGLHFLAFWPCGPSFPCILALWAFISLHFGIVGLHFLAFWPFGLSFPCISALWASFPCILAFTGSASGPPPTSCQKWPVCPTSLQWIYQRQDRLHFAVFSLLGLYFLSFWPCRPSFPCILALWAFIILTFWALWAFMSLHFGLVGLHFLAFWPCGPSFPCILALWVFISLRFGLLGFHFLAFRLCGLHFLAFWPFRGQLLGPPPQVAKNGPFAQRPYNGFISARTGSILQFLAFWAFISFHFGLVGLHFLAFWLCGPAFPFILTFWALWAFMSLHFGFVGFISLHFGLFGVSFGGPPTSCQKWPVCPTSLQWIYQRQDRLHFAVFSLLGLYFLAFWPCRPSFPCILALWAFISLHFGLVGLHFLAFWPCRPSFPCILALWAFISLHFGLVGHFLAFWPFGLSFPCISALWASFPCILAFSGSASGAPPTSCQKWPVCPTSLQWIYQRRDRLHFAVFSLLGLYFLAFWPCRPSFPCILALWAFISLHFGVVGLHFLAFWPCGPSFPCILAFSGSASGPPPQVAKNGPFAQRPYNGFIRAVTGSILQFLAFWAFISLHFGLVGLHFLAFWPCGSSFPCVLAFWAFISFHFGLVGLHFLAFWPFRGQLLGPPPTSC